MERSGEVRCVRIGVFRVLRTQEGQSATEGPVEEASCINCGERISREGVELNEETDDVLLKALLLQEEEVSNCRLWTCVGCYSSLHSFLSLIRQLEELRVKFNDQRRRLGHHIALKLLKKSQESYDGWLAAVKSVEDLFPSEVRKRLKKTCNVAVGTDEVVKIEEEEEFFDIIACKVETERFERYEVDEPHKIGDLGGNSAAGPSDEHLRGRNVSHASTKKSDVVAERACKQTKGSHSNAPTKRRSCVSEVKVVRSLSQVDTVEPARGSRTKCDVEESPDSHPTGLGTSTVDKTTVTSGVVSCCSLQTVSRPRRAIRKRVRYGEFQNEEEEIVSEKSEDAEFEDVGGNGQPSVACKPLTMSGCVKQPKKSTDGSNYHLRCKLCSKVFSGYSTLRRHCYEDHKEDYLKDLPLACLVCYHVFPSEMTLENHKKKHESQKCRFCGKFFLRKRSFIEHLRTHTGEKPYACAVCDRKFAHSCSLKDHMKTHTGEKPYACYFCDRKFSREKHLQFHMMTHTGEKPYACYFCDRKFSREHHLKDHMNIHTGEKPHVCSCGEYFRQRSVMNRHKRTTGHS